MMYSIIDIETTGAGNKITEIAILKHDGTQVIDSYSTLVNPEAHIPDYITALTGIDNAMVADAPTFETIAPTVLEFTKDTVFVAHNVNFDYNIIRNSFKVLNLDFRRKKLCTIRLSRKLLPGHSSYSLGKLCRSLEIPISDRHRAKGDADATAILFDLLLAQDAAETVFKDFLKPSSKEATLPPHLSSSVFENIPNKPGIYYFKDKKGKIIYVGKAKDLQKRVLGHFYNKSAKELELCRNTAHIDFELSGNETIALLMEDAAIKHHFPEYNLLAKRRPKTFGIFSYLDRQGINHLAFNSTKGMPQPIQTFTSIRECRSYLEQICKQFNLCAKFCHLQETSGACSHYSLTNCKGVCKGEELVTDYNSRVQEAINYMKQGLEDIVIKDTGRTPQETSFILIQQGMYLGYGFVDNTEQICNPEALEPFLIKQQDSMDVRKILRSVLS